MACNNSAGNLQFSLVKKKKKNGLALKLENDLTEQADLFCALCWPSCHFLQQSRNSAPEKDPGAITIRANYLNFVFVQCVCVCVCVCAL